MAATGLTAAQESAFRRKQLSPSEREELIKPFLPSDSDSLSDSSKLSAAKARVKADAKARARSRAKSSAPKRYGPIKTTLHFLIYHTIALLFSVFFRFRRAYRLVRGKIVELLKYHHRTPEFIAHDVKNLEKMPKHLSVIVDYQEDDEHQGTAGLEGLVNDVCEIAAWAASAGIPFLSVYERTGKYYPSTSPPPKQTALLTTTPQAP